MKIIHIDMDSFYASVEIRDNPHLVGKPVAIGGLPDKRGVLATCNYEARHYGLHAAMPTAQALRLCPQVVVIPPNMNKYREVSQRIHTILKCYTDIIEPLSLDEAYLDVSDSDMCHGSATWIAQKIREDIVKQEQLTASAGIAPNKFLAKVASDWQKPNGQFVITPQDIASFVEVLPVEKIFGVGKVTKKKMHALGWRTCGDLQKCSLTDLADRFGKFGYSLYSLCRGKDDRAVQTKRLRKSVSVEHTFSQDLHTMDDCMEVLPELYRNLLQRLAKYKDRGIGKQFVKIKFSDFSQTSAESLSVALEYDHYTQLMAEALRRKQLPIRLIGIGVRFSNPVDMRLNQLDLFSDDKADKMNLLD